MRCYVCNQWGHVCCKGAPTEAPVLSCHNCGEQGHLAQECWMTRPTQVGRCRRLVLQADRASSMLTCDCGEQGASLRSVA